MTDPAAHADKPSIEALLGVTPQKPWRTWLARGAALVALLLALYLLTRCFGGEDVPRYISQSVERGDLVVTVSATGNLKPVNQVDVGSEQSGLITHVLVDVNDQVTKGQLLARLDTSRLLDNVAQGRAQVTAAQAQVAQADAQASLARATLARQEHVHALSGGKVPSKTELDSARAQTAAAVATAQAARAQLAVARAQLSSAEINLSKARIVSPVTGVVLSRAIEPGQTVAASFNAPVLFTIAEDLRKMELEVAVDEADVGVVTAGQSAVFTVDAFPGRTFPARITRVNVGANTAGAATGSSSAAASVVSYSAVLAVDNQDQTLRPGMTATAEIRAREVKGALLVPNAALRFSPDAASGADNRGITGTLIPPRMRRGNGTRTVSFGAGSRQTVHVEESEGQLRAVNLIVGDSDGSMTVVSDSALKAGMRVVTGRLAAGQTVAGASGRRNTNGTSANGR